jgi:hypothetical protein
MTIVKISTATIIAAMVSLASNLAMAETRLEAAAAAAGRAAGRAMLLAGAALLGLHFNNL